MVTIDQLREMEAGRERKHSYSLFNRSQELLLDLKLEGVIL